MSYREWNPYPRYRMSFVDHLSQRQVTMAMPCPLSVETLNVDASDIARTGTLLKKDVFRWNLDFKLFSKPNIMRSDFFEFGPTPGYKYYLVTSIIDSMSTYFTVFLARIGSCPIKVPVKVSFALLDTRDRCHYPCEKQMPPGMCTVQTSFDRDHCTVHNSTFLVNNQMRIQCSLDVGEVIDELQAKRTSRADACNSVESTQDLTSDLRSLLESGQHSDVTLRLKGHEFKAHRSILVARSTVFAAMFEHDTLEKQQSNVDIVDIACDTMGHLLHYLYTGENKELTAQEFLSLFVAADKYNLPKLKKLCASSISPKITSDTALSVLTLAYLHQDEQLKEAAIDAVLENAMKIMKGEDWLVFLKEYSELANSVILKLAVKSQLE